MFVTILSSTCCTAEHKKEINKFLELFYQPTLTLNLLTTTIVAPPSNASKWQMGFNSAFKGLMYNFLYSLTICLLHYYPRHVSSINMSIFRRKNSIHTESGIFALCKRLPSTLVESGLTVRSQPVYCADVYRERRYQMLCEYNFSS